MRNNLGCSFALLIQKYTQEFLHTTKIYEQAFFVYEQAKKPQNVHLAPTIGIT